MNSHPGFEKINDVHHFVSKLPDDLGKKLPKFGEKG